MISSSKEEVAQELRHEECERGCLEGKKKDRGHFS